MRKRALLATLLLQVALLLPPCRLRAAASADLATTTPPTVPAAGRPVASRPPAHRFALRLSYVLPLLLLLLGPACASEQRLTASIYRHEQLAQSMDALGQPVAAAEQRRAAEREREQLAAMEGKLFARTAW